MSESTYDNKLRPGYYENNYANMAAAFIVETERWELAAKFFPPAKNEESATADQSTSMSHSGHGAMAGPAANVGTSNSNGATVRYSNHSQTIPLFIRGLAGAINGSAETENSLAGLKSILHGNASATGTLDIKELEVLALAASLKQDHAKAIELMKKATQLEEALGPPSGPPSLIKPSHELFGEILLRSGKPAEAMVQFQTALRRQPNRARSLLGLARANAQSGDKATAAATYAKLLDQWQQADESLVELREARDYLKRAK
jgi:tetratricopeptide (TPR) repeat protein